ncbi:MAG: amidohydrolase family protein [Gammaproteobacteria bacterium]|nr:amidohydrolase family protein [Gammaproteobacteria bacterium]
MQNIDKIISPKWVLSSKNDCLLEDHSIAIEGNIIKEVRPSREILNKYSTNSHLILKNHIIVPGLVNNNISTPYIFSKKYLKNKTITNRDDLKNKMYLSLSAKVIICKMIKNGITTFTDTSTYPDIVLKAAIESGIRANIGLPIMSYKTNWANKEQEYFKKSISFFDEYRDNPSTKLYLNLNSINMLSRKGFEKVSKIISELDVPVRMYLHEDLNKLNIFKKKYKHRPIRFLEEMGLLSSTFTAINPFHVIQSDINLMKKYKVHVVHSPTSNIINHNMKCNTEYFLKNKIKVSLGTGEYAINNSLDLFTEMRLVWLLSKLNKDKNNHLDKKELLGLIMHNGANALGLNFNMGKIKANYSADIISIKVDDIDVNSLSLYNSIENELISDNIENVWISGKQILKNKKLLTMNENMLYDEFTGLINSKV